MFFDTIENTCGVCAHCGEDIFEGDDIVLLDDGKRYHEDCFCDVAATILLERGIAERCTAENEHPEIDLDVDLAKEERRGVA